MAADKKKSPAAIEKRIQALIDQCRGIPPGDIIQLLMRGEHNDELDVEAELKKLFEKHKMVNSEQ